MLKNFISITLLFLYLITSMGVLVNYHYCGGKVKSVSIMKPAKKCCCASQGMDSNCCRNESLLFQLDTEQSYTVSQNFSFELIDEWGEFGHDLISDLIPIFPSFEESDLNQNIPPPLPDKPYIRFCSLTYYG